MDFRDRSSYALNHRVIAFVVLGILILVNVLSQRLFFRLDWTENDQYSISDSTQEVLAQLDDIVQVKAYVTNDLPEQAQPIRNYLRDILGEYDAYGSGNFSYQFIDPSNDPEAAQEAQNLGIRPQQMQVRENDSLQIKVVHMGVGIFYQGETESIPLIAGAELGSLEYELTSRIIKLSQPELSKVAFLAGHGEKSITPLGQGQEFESMTLAAQALRRNYEVVAVDFAQQQTLEGIDVLVVAGPQRDLTERAKFEIDQYLLRGGKAIFLVDGLKVLQGQGINVEVLETNAKSMLASLGVTVESHLMMDQLNEFVQFQEAGGLYFLKYPAFITLVSDNFSNHPVVEKVKSFVGRFISSLTIEQKIGLAYDRFVNTSPASWYQDYPFSVNPQALPPATAENGGSKTVGVEVVGMLPRISSSETVPQLEQWVEGGEAGMVLERVQKDDNRNDREIALEATAEGKVFVVADSDFTSDGYAGQDQSGLVVFMNMVDHLAFGDALISIRSKTVGSPGLYAIEDSTKPVLRFVGVLLVPILISAYGVYRLWSRRKEERFLRL